LYLISRKYLERAEFIKSLRSSNRIKPQVVEYQHLGREYELALCPPGSGPVKIVCAYVHRNHTIALNIKHSAQIAFNFHRKDRPVVMSGKAVNLVWTKAGVKRVYLENLPGTAR
jgi:hypothetical protein